MKNTSPNVSYKTPQSAPVSTRAQRLAVVAALATAVAMGPGCGGGSGGDANATNPVAPTPPPTPTVPVAPLPPPEVVSNLNAGVVGATPRTIADLFSQVNQTVQSAYVSRASTNNLATCTLRQEANGSYTLIITPSAPSPTEASDTCDVTAQEAGGTKLTVHVGSQVDTLAPRVQNSQVNINSYSEGSANSADLRVLLGQITDASETSLVITARDLPPGYTYDANTAKLSWTGSAVAGIISGNVVDVAGNPTPVTIRVNLASVYVPPAPTPTPTPPPPPPPPPPAPSCPPGYVYDTEAEACA